MKESGAEYFFSYSVIFEVFQGTVMILIYFHLSFLSETEFLIVFNDRHFCLAIWEGWSGQYRKYSPSTDSCLLSLDIISSQKGLNCAFSPGSNSLRKKENKVSQHPDHEFSSLFAMQLPKRNLWNFTPFSSMEKVCLEKEKGIKWPLNSSFGREKIEARHPA